jgi:regulator of cell morphogenesis and NO signaling
MTTEQANESIGSIAVAYPESVAVFAQHGLDFCCGGSRSLEEACATAGLDADRIRAEIRAATAERGLAAREAWHTMGMGELADHIERVHHARARELIARIDGLLPPVLAAHGDAHPELRAVAETFARFREELFDHMVREERVLFPWLRRLETPGSLHIGPPWSVARPISCMVHDHDDAAAALGSIRRALAGYTVPAGACGSYAALIATMKELDEDTRIHIHKENNALFPAGIRAEAARATKECAPPATTCNLPGALHSADAGQPH